MIGKESPSGSNGAALYSYAHEPLVEGPHLEGVGALVRGERAGRAHQGQQGEQDDGQGGGVGPQRASRPRPPRRGRRTAPTASREDVDVPGALPAGLRPARRLDDVEAGEPVRPGAGDEHELVVSPAAGQAVGQRRRTSPGASSHLPSSNVGQPWRATVPFAGDDDRPPADGGAWPGEWPRSWPRCSRWLARRLPMRHGRQGDHARRRGTPAADPSGLRRQPPAGGARAASSTGTTTGMPRAKYRPPHSPEPPRSTGWPARPGRTARTCRRRPWPAVVREGGPVDQEEPGGGQREGDEQARARCWSGRRPGRPRRRPPAVTERATTALVSAGRRRTVRAASATDASITIRATSTSPAAVVPGRQPGQDEPVHPPGQAGAGERCPAPVAGDRPGPGSAGTTSPRRARAASAADAGGRGHEEAVAAPGHERRRRRPGRRRGRRPRCAA